MPRTLDDSFATRRRQWKSGIRFSMWNVRSQCRSRSLTTVAKELARYKKDLVDVQKVRSGDYTGFFYRTVMYGRRRSPYGALVERHKGKRPLERPRRRWEFNMKMYLYILSIYTFFVYTVLSLFSLCEFFLNRTCLACIVVILCVFVVSYVYLLYLMCICVSYVYMLYLCVFVVLLCVSVVLLCVFVVLCVYCCSHFRCRTAG